LLLFPPIKELFTFFTEIIVIDKGGENEKYEFPDIAYDHNLQHALCRC
jgi:hypothetical protein